MRKIVLAALAATVVIGNATADVRTGFYVGATAAMNSHVNEAKIRNTTTGFTGSYNLGRNQFGGGAFVGYGFLCNCYYFAGEFAYNYNNHRSSSKTNNLATVTRIRLSNEHIFNFAVLAGHKLTPSTLAYIRLGVNWSELKMRAVVGGINLRRERGKASFAPGLGLKTWINRNINVRLEYTHDFGSELHRKRTVGGVTVHAKMNRIYNHSVKLGAAWVF